MTKTWQLKLNGIAEQPNPEVAEMERLKDTEELRVAAEWSGDLEWIGM